MVKVWECTAELNMCAEHIGKVTVKANTERKARIFAEKKFKDQGNFFVTKLDCIEAR